MSSPSSPGQVEQLSARLGVRWPAIEAARARADTTLQRLAGALEGCLPAGTCFITFGSLARRETTGGSDVDWRLLTDAAEDPDHRPVVREIRGRLAALGLDDDSPVSTSGVWRGPDLIASVGRSDDERETLARILLVLKSTAIGNPEVRHRVARGIVRRYLEQDVQAADPSPYRIPRALLNDVLRYQRGQVMELWRKRRNDGWAVRSAKLRMPRRLSCAAGVLTCLSCDYALDAAGVDAENAMRRRVDHLSRAMSTSPLDVVAGTVLRFGELSAPGRELMSAYDDFLRLLDSHRGHLRALRPRAAAADDVHAEVRRVGLRFRRALTGIFSDGTTPLPELTRRYGLV